MKNLKRKVSQKINAYKPKGGLDHTARFVLNLCRLNHNDVEGHLERVGLTAERVAELTGKDAKAAFFAGILHDIGKVLLPSYLFKGQNITAEEYRIIKTHAQLGFDALKDTHLFTAYCAGLHHNLYRDGYGLSVKNFPKKWGVDTIKLILDISMIISICDFIDAASTRSTKRMDGSEGELFDLLRKKYKSEEPLIHSCLAAYNQLFGEG